MSMMPVSADVFVVPPNSPLGSTTPTHRELHQLEVNALAIIEQLLINKNFYNPRIHGGVFDGVADDTAAIQASIADIAASGAYGVVVIPGVANFSHLDCTSATNGIAFVGTGPTWNLNSQQSVLRCTATGSTTAIDIHGLVGVSFVNVSIRYTSGSFTGKLIDAHSASYLKFVNCLIRPESTVDSHSSLIFLEDASTIDFSNCCVIGSKALYGMSSNSHICQRLTFVGGYIQGRNSAAIWNPDIAWAFFGVTMKPLTAGTDSGKGKVCGHDSGVLARGITFQDCSADGNTVAAEWIRLGGKCIVLRTWRPANANQSGGCILKIDENNSSGIVVEEMEVENNAGAFLVDFGAVTGTKGIVVGKGCTYTNVPTALINGTKPDASWITFPAEGPSYYAAGTTRRDVSDDATRYVEGSQVFGDAQFRWKRRVDGAMQWGSGSATPDVVGPYRISAGVLAIDQALKHNVALTSVTTTYNIVDPIEVVFAGGTTAYNVKLPTVASGRQVTVKRTGTGVITIIPNSAETIDGLASLPISVGLVSESLYCDGTNWWRV